MATGQEGRGNIALLIDADNASAAHFDSVMTVLAELGTVNIRRAYGNWSKATLKTWAALSVAHAIEPQQQFDLTKGKNATDMKMTIDAMDLMASGRVDGFGLMSSDSDFTPLATRIRQQGIPVYGFGSANTPEGFRRACTRFLNVAAPGEVRQAGYVAHAHVAGYADMGRLAIAEAVRLLVAIGTGHAAVPRQSPIVEKATAQRDLGRVHAVIDRDSRCGDAGGQMRPAP